MRAYKFLDKHFGLKSLYERRLRVSTLDDLNDPFELLPYAMPRLGQQAAFHELRDKPVKEKGVVCFSTTWADPVVWAHYADKHRGICLGFEIYNFQKVDYVKERLIFPSDITLDALNAILSTKYENWQYEKEIRFWTRLDQKEDGHYFYEFGDDLELCEVILGARCTLPEREILRALGPLAKDVSIAKARAAFDKFEIVEQSA